jgi:hypothetical protein
MHPSTVEAIQPLLDQLSEVVDQQLAAPELQHALAKLSQTSGKGLTVSVNVTVEVFDEARGHPLPLLTTGISSDSGKEPHRTWDDSSLQRYVVEAGIQAIPHDRCPKCWGVWDFKFQHPTCENCAATLGEDCKVLLDSDECPWCQQGKVTVAIPRCKQCGFVVDPRMAVWGQLTKSTESFQV